MLLQDVKNPLLYPFSDRSFDSATTAQDPPLEILWGIRLRLHYICFFFLPVRSGFSLFRCWILSFNQMCCARITVASTPAASPPPHLLLSPSSCVHLGPLARRVDFFELMRFHLPRGGFLILSRDECPSLESCVLSPSFLFFCSGKTVSTAGPEFLLYAKIASKVGTKSCLRLSPFKFRPFLSFSLLNFREFHFCVSKPP